MADKLRFLLICIVAIVSDQISKIIIIKNIPLYASIKIIPGFFDITHLHNMGGAFGLGANQSEAVRTFVFIGMAFLALILILWFYKTTPKEFVWLRIAYSMILGGAIGNLIDRIRMGYVVDFLDVYIKNMHWPAFNIADSFITIGMGIILLHVAFNKLPKD